MAVVFKSKSQYLALLVALRERLVTVNFDCNMIFDGTATQTVESPRPFLFLLFTQRPRYKFLFEGAMGIPGEERSEPEP